MKPVIEAFQVLKSTTHLNFFWKHIKRTFNFKINFNCKPFSDKILLIYFFCVFACLIFSIHAIVYWVGHNLKKKHGTNFAHDTVSKVINKFQKTRNIKDQPRMLQDHQWRHSHSDTSRVCLSPKKYMTVVCWKLCQQIE